MVLQLPTKLQNLPTVGPSLGMAGRGSNIAVPIPAGMSWEPGFKTMLSGGTYLTDYLPTAFKPIVTGSTFYVDPVSGNNANTGLSPALAVATLRNALGKVNAVTSSLVHRIVVNLPSKWVFRGTDGWSISLTRRCVVEVNGGRAISALSATNTALTYTKSAGYTNVYETALAAAPSRVYDLSLLSPKMLTDIHVPVYAASECPNYDKLASVASIALCDETPGSYFWTGGVLYTHPRDNRASDALVQPVTSGVNGSWVPGSGVLGATLWVDGIDFVGGSIPMTISEAVAAGGTGGDPTLRAYFSRCSYQGSTDANDAFVHVGYGDSYHYHCGAFDSGVDGFSAYGINAASNTEPCANRVEIGSGSFNNGIPAQTQANGTTTHNGKVISINPWHLGANNRTAHFVNACRAWLAGGYIGPSASASGASSCSLQIGNGATEPAQLWVDGVTVLPGSLTDVRVTTLATLYHQRMKNLSGLIVDNQGTITPYT
ncbi:hypothetical protein LJR221_001416 [Agrobacterium tumefaciens]